MSAPIRLMKDRRREMIPHRHPIEAAAVGGTPHGAQLRVRAVLRAGVDAEPQRAHGCTGWNAPSASTSAVNPSDSIMRRARSAPRPSVVR